MKQIKQQIDEIKKELQQNPNDAELLSELGVGYHMMGDYDKAVQAYQQSLKEDSSNFKTHFNLANTFVELQQINAAVNHYLDALDIQPDYVPALNNLADIYQIAEEPDQAQELFEYITKIKPEEAMGYFNLGNHHLRHNNTVEAGRCYKKAIELNPDFYEAYNNIGYMLKHLEQYEEAISYYEQCLEIVPSYKPAKKDLAECRQALNQS